MQIAPANSVRARFLFAVNPVYRPELVPVANAMLKAAGSGARPFRDAAETDVALTGLVSQVRKLLVRDPSDLKTESLGGQCGRAQSATIYMLEDFGLQGQCVALQSVMTSKAWYRHVWATVALPTKEGPAWYLLDPTYQQFCQTGLERGAPGALFAQAQTLVRDGFLKLDVDVADGYLKALNSGRAPFWMRTAALRFMKEPPHHPDNMWFPRESALKPL